MPDNGDNNIIKVVFEKLRISIRSFLSPTIIVTPPQMTNRGGWHLKNNSPIIVSYIVLSIIAFWLKNTTFGQNISPWLSLPNSLNSGSFISNLRFLTFIFGYENWGNLLQNITFLLLLGPLVETRYSSKLVFLMVLSTALVVGFFQVLFYGGNHGSREIGGACIVYMLIMVASATNVKSNEIPITLVLLIVFLIGGLSITGSRHYNSLPPVVGGILGFVFAIVMPRIFPNIRIISLPTNENKDHLS